MEGRHILSWFHHGDHTPSPNWHTQGISLARESASAWAFEMFLQKKGVSYLKNPVNKMQLLGHEDSYNSYTHLIKVVMNVEGMKSIISLNHFAFM